MSFGYPGDNLHLEHHGVSEESFWPSFTDIMMVIVMVFLLVTIAVILNNWTLIADLKESIAKQQLASNMADNKEVENISLEAKLTYLEKQLTLFKQKTAQEQENVVNIQTALSKEQENVANIQAALSTEQENSANIQAALTTAQEKVVTTQADLSKEQEKLTTTQTELSNTQDTVKQLTALSSEQKTSIEATEKTLLVAQNSLEDNAKQIASLTEQRDKQDESLENKLLALSLMKNNKASLKVKVDNLQTKLTAAINKMDVLMVAKEKIESNKIANNDLKAKLQLVHKDNEEKDDALQRLQEEKERVQTDLVTLQSKTDESVTKAESAETKIVEIEEELLKANKKITDTEEELAVVNKKFSETEIKLTEVNDKFSETETKLTAVNKKLTDIESDSEEESDEVSDLESVISEKDKTIEALKKKQSEGNSQLLSLKGEYDTLDSKYQKLLRPARSSKGKYIVSVSYKKVGGKKTIRLKSGPNASYKTLSKREMQKTLEKLKKKHKTDLYVKIIIPEKSGLSYNEAWRFTSNLQKKYDYYFQPDSGSKSKSKKSSK